MFRLWSYPQDILLCTCICKYAEIQNRLKSETLLVSSTSHEGYSTCIINLILTTHSKAGAIITPVSAEKKMEAHEGHCQISAMNRNESKTQTIDPTGHTLSYSHAASSCGQTGSFLKG